MIVCPNCGAEFPETEFDIDEGDSLVCQKCEWWFPFDFSTLDYESDFEIGEEPF